MCVCLCVSVVAALQSVNAALRENDPRRTISCLMTSDLQLPEVFPFAATFYHRELQLLQRQTAQVTTAQVEHRVYLEMSDSVTQGWI